MICDLSTGRNQSRTNNKVWFDDTLNGLKRNASAWKPKEQPKQQTKFICFSFNRKEKLVKCAIRELRPPLCPRGNNFDNYIVFLYDVWSEIAKNLTAKVKMPDSDKRVIRSCFDLFGCWNLFDSEKNTVLPFEALLTLTFTCRTKIGRTVFNTYTF